MSFHIHDVSNLYGANVLGRNPVDEQIGTLCRAGSETQGVVHLVPRNGLRANIPNTAVGNFLGPFCIQTSGHIEFQGNPSILKKTTPLETAANLWC